MTILIGKPEHCSSSAVTRWRAEDHLSVSHGSYSEKGGGNHMPFWSINNCVLGIDIDIASETTEYIEMTELFSNLDNVNEKLVIEYVTKLILKYITPTQFLISITNESSKQFRRGQQNKVDEIKLAVSKLGFNL